MNKMKEVVELLGVQFGEEFSVINRNGKEINDKFSFSEKGLLDGMGYVVHYTLTYLLTGEYKIKKPILDKQEKQYLESVIRPFKDRVSFIVKNRDFFKEDYEYIAIGVKDDNSICFPNFKIGSMYKNMERHKFYTLKELGLFEDEN